MLYTRKGDTGTTTLFNCPKGSRINKSAFVFDALGSLDELTSSLGFAKALSEKSQARLTVDGLKIAYWEILDTIQNNLFSIQAEVGGVKTMLEKEHTLYLEKILESVDMLLPPITSFIVPGGTEVSAYLDVCRSQTRAVERKVIILNESKEGVVSPESLVFLNRLSSALYGLARYANYQSGYPEHAPVYT